MSYVTTAETFENVRPTARCWQEEEGQFWCSIETNTLKSILFFLMADLRQMHVHSSSSNTDRRRKREIWSVSFWLWIWPDYLKHLMMFVCFIFFTLALVGDTHAEHSVKAKASSQELEDTQIQFVAIPEVSFHFLFLLLSVSFFLYQVEWTGVDNKHKSH